MTDIEARALALLNDVRLERGLAPVVELYESVFLGETLRRAVEQHEAFRREVSYAVGDTLFMVETHCDGEASALVSNRLLQFIIPAPKPDPLVEVVHKLGWDKDTAADLRAALEYSGFEIREKVQ